MAAGLGGYSVERADRPRGHDAGLRFCLGRLSIRPEHSTISAIATPSLKRGSMPPVCPPTPGRRGIPCDRGLPAKSAEQPPEVGTEAAVFGRPLVHHSDRVTSRCTSPTPPWSASVQRRRAKPFGLRICTVSAFSSASCACRSYCFALLSMPAK